MADTDVTRPPKRFRLNSIFIKVAGLFAVAAVALTGFMAVKAGQSMRQIVIAEIQDAGRDVNQIATGNLTGAIRFADAGPIADQIGALTEEAGAETVYGLALDASGAVIAAGGPRPDLEPGLTEIAREALATGAPAGSPDGALVATPAMFGGKVVGAFATATTAEFALAGARAAQDRVTLIALAIVALGIGAMIAAVRYLIARPIARLTWTLDEITRGNLDVSVPDRTRGDELGRIATAMERLRGALAEAAVAKTENQFRGAAFHASAAAMMMVDRAGSVTHANEALQQLLARHADGFASLGLRPAAGAIIGVDLASCFPEASRREVAAALAAPETLPRRVQVALGEVRLQVFLSTVEDEDGGQIGFVAEWQDITESNLNAAVLAALDAGQLRADFSTDGALIAGNAGLRAAWGIAADAYSALPRLPDVPDLAEAFRDIRAGTPVIGVFPGLVTRDGAPVLTDGVFAPVKDETGQITRIVLIGRDVTETQASLKRAEADRAEMLVAQASVVNELRRGLGRLRDGDLTVRIEKAFGADYEQLRADFNLAVAHLLEAMTGVIENAGQIQGEAAEISNAADDLSQRTERQAATLEQTASALDQLTSSVRSAADGAEHANKLARDAGVNAETSGAIVREAVAAMGAIETSSEQIAKITDVIDDIAFQ
ncbi:MAG: HAMP domain-containing protein, partial [Maritimibacter sp.]|nr:HAMP domain-containing protein [Maritimibacter sp.]